MDDQQLELPEQYRIEPACTSVSATYRLENSAILHYMEVFRCTREWAIRELINRAKPSIVRENRP